MISKLLKKKIYHSHIKQQNWESNKGQRSSQKNQDFSMLNKLKETWL